MLLPTEIHRCAIKIYGRYNDTIFSKDDVSVNSERGTFIGNLSLNQLLKGYFRSNSVNIIREYFFHLPQVKITIDYTHTDCVALVCHRNVKIKELKVFCKLREGKYISLGHLGPVQTPLHSCAEPN